MHNHNDYYYNYIHTQPPMNMQEDVAKKKRLDKTGYISMEL